MSTKPNLLIIGGSSFVAKNIIQLLSNQYDIKTISRKSTSYSNEYILENFFNIPEELFHQTNIVINCAAIVHQQKEPSTEAYNKVNYELASSIAKKAKNAGVKTFIQLSTIAVYGNAKHITGTTPENPINAYGKSKLVADKELTNFKSDSFNVLIFRPPLIYGGGKDAPGNMMRLINLIRRNIPLPFSGQLNKRDFIHIQNLIGFINAGIKKNISGIYLVSDNHPVSVSNLYDIIVKYLKIPNRSFKVPGFLLQLLKLIKPGIYEKLFSNLSIDVSESIRILGFMPENLIEKGITEMTLQK